MNANERARLLESAYVHSFPGMRANENKKKIQILKSCITSIASDGVQAFNLGSVARKLKMSRSNLQYYFKSNEVLLESIVRLITATAQQVTILEVERDEASGAEAKIEAIIRAAFIWTREYPAQASCMLMFYFYTAFDSRLLHLSNHIRDAGRGRIQALLCILGKVPQPGEEEKTLALQIQATLTGFLVSSLIHPAAGTSERFEENCQDLVRKLTRESRA